MNKGLFDLTNFESKSDDDIINMNINESAKKWDGPSVKYSEYDKMSKEEKEEFQKKVKEHLDKKKNESKNDESHNESTIFDFLDAIFNEGASEFAHHNPDTNHPSDTFDSTALSGNEQPISIPGGLKETPNAKPYDASSVTIPGGDSETPKAKPYDSASISVPSKTILTTAEWDTAMAALKKSFKEGVEIMEMLEKVIVVEKTTEQLQEEYVESVIGDQLLAAYEDGPVFEAVDRKDKDDVKSLVKDLREKMPEMAKKYNIKFKPPKTFLRLLLNSSATINTSETSKYHVADRVNWWTTRFWQVLGVVYADNADIKTVIESMNEDLKDTLGEYRILYSMSFKGLYDLWNTKFGWKNRNEVFFLIVDKTLPKELKAIQTDMEEALNKKEEKKEK